MFRRMNAIHSTVSLAEVAHVRQGHPFRGAIPAVSDGHTRVIQLKNLMPFSSLDPEQLLRTRLRTRKEPNCVQHDDVLIAGRGNRPVAVVLADPAPGTVCSPHLYVLHVTAKDRILPAFLAWQLNQNIAQEQFRREAAGTRQQSLRKHAVEELAIRIPPLSTQRRIVAIAGNAHNERSKLERFMSARDHEVTSLTEQLLHGSAE